VPHRHKVHGTAIIVENKHVMVLQNMNMFSESDCAISNELQSNSNCTRLPALEQCSHRFTIVHRICMFKDMDDQPADCSYMGMYLGHGPFATEAICTALVLGILPPTVVTLVERLCMLRSTYAHILI
jgi:hypothetical protein